MARIASVKGKHVFTAKGVEIDTHYTRLEDDSLRVTPVYKNKPLNSEAVEIPADLVEFIRSEEFAKYW